MDIKLILPIAEIILHPTGRQLQTTRRMTQTQEEDFFSDSRFARNR